MTTNVVSMTIFSIDYQVVIMDFLTTGVLNYFTADNYCTADYLLTTPKISLCDYFIVFSDANVWSCLCLSHHSSPIKGMQFSLFLLALLLERAIPVTKTLVVPWFQISETEADFELFSTPLQVRGPIMSCLSKGTFCLAWWPQDNPMQHFCMQCVELGVLYWLNVTVTHSQPPFLKNIIMNHSDLHHLSRLSRWN